MPGLLRGMARVAVVSGTATAVSNRVSRRQAGRWADQDQQDYYQQLGQQAEQASYAAPQPAYAAAPPAAAPDASYDDKIAQLKELAELKDAGVLTEEEFATQKARILG